MARKKRRVHGNPLNETRNVSVKSEVRLPRKFRWLDISFRMKVLFQTICSATCLFETEKEA